MKTKTAAGTPLMRQYRRIKDQHPDAILFFRMGDFYETFEDDAVTAARVLGITLTSRNNGGAAETPLAGVPVKAVDGYVRKLVAQGYKVAICEQLEDPKLAKGIVDRGVTEVVTPGTVLEDSLLDSRRNSWLVAVTCAAGAGARSAAGSARPSDEAVGLALLDCSTGELWLMELLGEDLAGELQRIGPAELLVPSEWRGARPASAAGVAADLVAAPRALDPVRQWRPDLPVSFRDGWRFAPDEAQSRLCRRFGVASLDGFGLSGFGPAIGAAGAALAYLEEVQPGAVAGLRPPRPLFPDRHLVLDETTLANLEILEPLRDGGHQATLLGVIDRTRTAPGARRLRQWLARPLAERAPIVARHQAVGALVQDGVARDKLGEALKTVHDLERLAGRAAAGRASPRDLVALADTLRQVPVVRAVVDPLPAPRWAELAEELEDHAEIVGRIDEALVDQPPASLGEGDVIRAGHDAELDRLRSVQKDGRSWIARLQEEERARTGIPSLKVGFNKVFGYYLEVTKTHLAKVPPEWIRKQTIANGERFVTPELKEVESEILHAEERIAARESELFAAVRAEVGGHAPALQRTADALAEVDVLWALADVAAREGWCRPEMADEPGIAIVAGRHPVVERWLEGEKFVPNDTALGGSGPAEAAAPQIVILTGPNMAGKSTYLRQIGLIVVLAQMGSWVPAESARIGIVDRLFTRVGASDNLARGHSTFLVEMIETANILHNATDRSLVLLDEVGRGTSTFDGLAIAWAVTEYLHEGAAHPLTIFATHYHELTELAAILPRVANVHVEVRELGEEIVFLKRVAPGSSDRSYGIHVGRLAGLPERVVDRAKEVLRNLEAGEWTAQNVPALAPGSSNPGPARRGGAQLSLLSAPHPIIDEVLKLNPDSMTPHQAHSLIRQWSNLVRGEL